MEINSIIKEANELADRYNLKVANITITLLITLIGIYLLMTGNEYKNLFKNR